MKLLGHRGARHEHPENTLRGIQHALDCGMEGVEIDIHGSSDGELMVIHDFTLDRTTNGTGDVSTYSKDELKKLDAGSGEAIPTLREVLDLVYGKAVLFIEVKGKACEEKLVELLKEYPDQSWYVIKSFDHRILKTIHELNPSLKLAALMVGVPANPLAVTESCGAKSLSIALDYLDKELVDVCHQQGLEVYSWNCNQPERLEEIAATGVDWLGTDIPGLMN